MKKLCVCTTRPNTNGVHNPVSLPGSLFKYPSHPPLASLPLRLPSLESSKSLQTSKPSRHLFAQILQKWPGLSHLLQMARSSHQNLSISRSIDLRACESSKRPARTGLQPKHLGLPGLNPSKLPKTWNLIDKLPNPSHFFSILWFS